MVIIIQGPPIFSEEIKDICDLLTGKGFKIRRGMPDEPDDIRFIANNPTCTLPLTKLLGDIIIGNATKLGITIVEQEEVPASS